MGRKYIFNAGPAVLPLEVLEKAQKNLVDLNGIGQSILEISHRSKDFDNIIKNTTTLMRKLFGVPDNYHILYLGGGASTQFATIPMNFLTAGKKALYVDTGAWSQKAIKEAKKSKGECVVAASSEDKNYNYIPDYKIDTDAAYLHLTSNNTIFGTQFKTFPDTKTVPLICDMSSDILSRKVDINKFSMIYAGAQKNLGPAGVTVVIIKDDLVNSCPDDIPVYFNYKTHADKDSLYNTPPCFPIYIVMLVLEWIEKSGGLDKIEKINEEKGGMLYDTIDKYPDFYKGTAEKDSRSLMNVTFRLPNEELEKKFIEEASSKEMVGLKGHRSVGGIRASIYNALPVEGVEKLCDFMKSFATNNK